MMVRVTFLFSIKNEIDGMFHIVFKPYAEEDIESFLRLFQL